MIPILMPVVLSVLLGPGMGQLYNREFKKGCVLIVASIGILLAFVYWISRSVMNYLPSALDMTNPDALRAFLQANIKSIQTNVISDHPFTFYTYEAVLGVLWVYGVVDAYLGGVRLRAKKQQDSPSLN